MLTMARKKIDHGLADLQKALERGRKRLLSAEPPQNLGAAGERRVGVEELVAKHASAAARTCPSIAKKHPTPHVLRHSCVIYPASDPMRDVSSVA